MEPRRPRGWPDLDSFLLGSSSRAAMRDSVRAALPRQQLLAFQSLEVVCESAKESLKLAPSLLW